MSAGAAAVEEYIRSAPAPARAHLTELRALVRELVPGGEERISYRMPAMDFHGIVVWFGAFEHHVGLYPGAAAVKAFEPELGDYKHAKGSIQLPLDRPLPRALIARIVKFKLAANLKARP